MSDDLSYTLDEIVKRTGFDKRTTTYYVQKGLLPKVGRRGPKTRYPKVFLDRLLFIKMIREQQNRGEIGNLTLANIRDILDHVRPGTIADMVNGRDSLHGIASMKVAQPAATAAQHESPLVKPVAPTAQVETAEAAPEPPHRQILHDESSDVIEVPIDDRGEVSNPPDAEVDVSSPNRNTVDRFAVPQPARDGSTEKVGVQRPLGYEGGAKEDASEKVVTVEQTVGSNGIADVDPEDRLGWSLARLQKAVDKPRTNSGTTESWHRARVTPELTISARNLSENDAYLLDAVARMLKKMLWQAWEE